MKIIFSLLFPLFLSAALFSAAAENTPSETIGFPERPEARTIQEPTDPQKELFAVLRKAFPGEVLDAKLQNLQKLSEHPDYLHYLTQVHGGETPFKTFEAFTQIALPPKTRYLTICQKLFDIQTSEEIDTNDVAVIYTLEKFLNAHLIKKNYYMGEQQQDLSGMASMFQLLAQPAFQNWMQKRGLVTNGTPDIMKIINLSIYTTPLLIVDAAWIQGLFERYGESEGALYLAIQDPLLLERCLANFSDIPTFLKWVETDGKVLNRKKKEKPE